MVKTKAALQTLWKDALTVTEYKEVQNLANFSTGFEEVAVLKNQPCKLSFTTLSSTNQNDTDAKLVQVTKIFLSNAVEIKPGSKITVFQKSTGRTLEFSQSGLPGLFTNHQEIVLVPFAGWA